MLLALLACAPPPGEPETLLTGWEYAWEELSHRVSYLRIGVGEDTRLSLGLVGGDWSTGATYADTPTYRVSYQRVTARDLTVIRGTAELLVGPDPTASTELVLDAADVPEDAALAAILNGFSIDTGVPQSDDYPDYDARYGYTSNGFGFALGEPVRDGDTVRIPVEATVRWGPQDREDMNAAIPFAVTAVTVDVALLAGPSAPEVATVSAASDLAHDPPYSDQPPMTADVAFADGAKEGVVGWRRFDLQLNLEGIDAGNGDYLRAFGVELAPDAVEAGGFDGTATATLSTSSVLELSDPYAAFEGEVVRMGAADVVADYWIVSGSHPTGAAVTGVTAE